MLSFKEFCLTLPRDITEHERATEMYQEYKLQFRKNMLAQFFAEHSEEEWFLEKCGLRIVHLDQKTLQISSNAACRGARPTTATDTTSIRRLHATAGTRLVRTGVRQGTVSLFRTLSSQEVTSRAVRGTYASFSMRSL